MKKLLLLVVAVFLLTGSVFGAERKVRIYDLDWDVEDSQVEAAPEGCTVKDRGQGGTTRSLVADCEIITQNADTMYIWWTTIAADADVLGTHASTDWSLNIRCIALKGDNYIPTGTDPTDTSYHEEDINLDAESGGFALTPPGGYACKLRVDSDAASVAAPSVRVTVEY